MVDAISAIGQGGKTEKAKKINYKQYFQDTFNQAVAAYNMFKTNPALIGNILNGSQTAATNQ